MTDLDLLKAQAAERERTLARLRAERDRLFEENRKLKEERAATLTAAADNVLELNARYRALVEAVRNGRWGPINTALYALDELEADAPPLPDVSTDPDVVRPIKCAIVDK